MAASKKAARKKDDPLEASDVSFAAEDQKLVVSVGEQDIVIERADATRLEKELRRARQSV